MLFRKGQSKKDPKKVASMLRQAIAGEELVKESIKGIDLSKLTTDQLKALFELKKGNLSKEELQLAIKRILSNGGPEPITAMKLVHNGEVITLAENDKPTWFDGPNKPGGYTGPKPSWWGEEREWHEEKTYEQTTDATQPEVISQPVVEPPKEKRKKWWEWGKEVKEVCEVEEVQEVKLKPGSQEDLKLKLAKMEKEFERNGKVHDELERLNKANADLSKQLRFMIDHK